MIFQIRFNPEQVKVLDGLMEELYQRAIDMSPALRAVTYIYLERQRAIFAGDNTWKPLTPGTLATKERTGHQQMMVHNGNLKGSLTLRKGGNRWASTTNSGTWALMGTKAPHAHLQAIGTKERDRWRTGYGRTGSIPGRSMAFVDAAMVNEMYATLENWLVDGRPEPGGAPSTPVIDISGFDQKLGI